MIVVNKSCDDGGGWRVDNAVLRNRTPTVYIVLVRVEEVNE